jgi:NADPH:quinone reductase
VRAIVREEFGGLDSLLIKEIPEPEPKVGHVVIQVKAFGINHAEMHMRRGEWAKAAPVSGIECVGVVKSCPGGEFPVGSRPLFHEQPRPPPRCGVGVAPPVFRPVRKTPSKEG